MMCVYIGFISWAGMSRGSRVRTGHPNRRWEPVPRCYGAPKQTMEIRTTLLWGTQTEDVSFPSAGRICMLCYLMFFTSSVLVSNPRELLYTVANPARGLLNREMRTKSQKVWEHPSPPPPRRCSFGGNKIKYK